MHAADHVVCARRMEQLEGVLRTRSSAKTTGARETSRSARANARASSTASSESCVPCTMKKGGASGET